MVERSGLRRAESRVSGDELLTHLLTFMAREIRGIVGAGLSVAGEPSSGDGEGCTPPVKRGGAPRSVASIGVAGELDAAQWDQGTGPIWDAFRSGRLVLRGDAAEPDGVERDGAGARVSALGFGNLDGTGVRKVLDDVRGAVFSAGEWGGELPVVLSVYLDREADDRTLREIDRYEPMVTQALAVVEYCAGEEEVARQMLQMTQYRRVIEQAKGLVMGAVGGDASSAFATLARASQHFNVRLRNLAVALVEQIGGGTAEHPDDPELIVRPSAAERQIADRVWAALTTSAGVSSGVLD